MSGAISVSALASRLYVLFKKICSQIQLNEQTLCPAGPRLNYRITLWNRIGDCQLLTRVYPPRIDLLHIIASFRPRHCRPSRRHRPFADRYSNQSNTFCHSRTASSSSSRRAEGDGGDQFVRSTTMKQESNSPKGGNLAADAAASLVNNIPRIGASGSGTDSVVSGGGGLVRDPTSSSKSIFDISNDELMNFLTGNNDSLNFLDIKEATSQNVLGKGGPPTATATTGDPDKINSDRPRRTSRKVQSAWVGKLKTR